MKRQRDRRAWVVGGSLTALLLTACTAPDGTSPSGFAASTVELSLGVADPPGRYSWELAEEFARRVEVATAGEVQITVTSSPGTQGRRWNQALAEDARAGDFDLALVQAQAWDALGVDSLDALYVPSLVTDEEVLDAVATGEVADDLLAGLDGTGVTALALLPGGLRHLFGEEEAAVRPEDVAGAGVRAGYSEAVWAMLEALGALPQDPNGDAMGEALRAGTIRFVDSTFLLSDSVFSSPEVAGDVVIYPLAFTLVVNDDRWAGLSAGQRSALEEAAADTAAWAAATRPSEADSARALCERNPGSRVVLAGADAVGAWHDATRDVASELRADPAVEALASRIEHVRDGLETSAEPVAPCAGAEQKDEPTSAGPNVPEEFPEGLFRKEVTADELVDAGVNTSDAQGHAGVWTLSLRDGVVDDPGCPGSTYEIVGDRIVVTMGPEGESCGEARDQVLFSAGWRLEGGNLTFTDVRSGHGFEPLVVGLFGTEPWTKIE